MSIQRKILTWLFAFLIMGVLVAFIPRLVSASLPPGSPLPTPVAPEPYPNTDTYPAVVYLARSDDLQVLYDQKIDIGDLKPVDGTSNSAGSTFGPSIATVYINPSQSGALIKAGLSPVPIPNDGYRSFLAYGPGSGAPNAWPTYEQYVARMQALKIAHPDIVDLVQIGSSVQNRGLYCMEITDHPGVAEIEPEFKYTAAHHGDETTGIEMTMRLAELLANSYGLDPVITDMVDKMEIWLCPIYNPDGYVNGTRYNAHGVDLNRNYPDRFTGPPANPQPETTAFMNFETSHRFVMGANYHGGEQVLNYPWDAVAAPGDPMIPAYAPDDQLFYDFGLGYTSRNPDLWNNPYFYHGITRGWEWYQIWGGMQDWDYYYHGEHHVTLEISWDKNPAFNSMDGFWNRNRDAMLWWLQRVWTGMSGLVLDARDNTPLDATVTLVGRDVPNIVLTDPQVGDYYRVISDGNYTLEAAAEGYQSLSADIMVYSGTLTTHDFYMCPEVPWVVSGTITDSVSGLPLQAMIEFFGSHQITSSDPDSGDYSLTVCPSTYTMRVSALWHYPEEREVNIDHNQVQNFALNPMPNLTPSMKEASVSEVLPGETVQYHLHVENIGVTSPVFVTDTLPISLTWTGDLTATQGIPSFDAGRILWQGEVDPGYPVEITYSARVNPCLPAGTTILNIAQFDDHLNGIITGKVTLDVGNSAPSVPASPLPVDGTVQQPITSTLSWVSTDLNCDQITYDLAFGKVSPPPLIENGLTSPIYDPGALNPATTYYWQVIVSDGVNQIIGPEWKFSTIDELKRIFMPLATRGE
jgi:uncharacterized repeat protein (TIGR01451 family)